MKRFRSFLLDSYNSMGYKKNSIPVGDYDNDDRMNTDVLLKKAEQAVSNHSGDDYPTVSMDVPGRVKDGKLKSTQSWLHREGGFDPVVPELENEMIVNYSLPVQDMWG